MAEMHAKREALRHRLRIALLSSKPFPVEDTELFNSLAFYTNETTSIPSFLSNIEEGIFSTRGLDFQVLYMYPLTRGKLLAQDTKTVLVNLELRYPLQKDLPATVLVSLWKT